MLKIKYLNETIEGNKGKNQVVEASSAIFHESKHGQILQTDGSNSATLNRNVMHGIRIWPNISPVFYTLRRPPRVTPFSQEGFDCIALNPSSCKQLSPLFMGAQIPDHPLNCRGQDKSEASFLGFLTQQCPKSYIL